MNIAEVIDEGKVNMSIQAMSNVSFGATTKNGNDYKKTHVATIAGTAVGTGIGGLGVYNLTKLMKKEPIIKRAMTTTLTDLRRVFMEGGKTKAQATKMMNRTFKSGIALGVVSWALVGLGIGAGINKIINNHKAAKVDKATAKAE